MSTGLKQVAAIATPTQQTRKGGDQSLLDLYRSRQANEIVISFAGPIGTGIASIINKTRTGLLDLGYTRVKTIKLSEFLSDAASKGQLPEVELPADCSSPYKRYRTLQQAGRDLREKTNNMQVLAEYAVQQIGLDREAHREHGDNQRVAYLIDQVKRPEEVELLRALYRNLFYLVGVTKPHQQRHKVLEDSGVYLNEIEGLMDIDRDEEGSGGQRLDKTLHLADFFVRNDFNLDQRDSINRFVRLIHGDKSKTPDRLETGMYAAYAAGLRSACLSRQVGAAITNREDEIIATGCNDVPAPLGGLYSANSQFDGRCMHLGGKECFNDREKRQLQSDIGDVFRRSLGALSPSPPAPEEWIQNTLKAIYSETRLGSLIEFSRSVHAEMDAIVSLARAGSVGIEGATLYTTTFPCHSCARHIVAAGITEVYYVEPYDKSMAETLHSDAISFEEPHTNAIASTQGNAAPQKKVKFLHFEGVSPRLFATVFRADNRKNKATGRFIELSLENPSKVLPEYLDNYKHFEDAAVAHFQDVIGMLSKPNT